MCCAMIPLTPRSNIPKKDIQILLPGTPAGNLALLIQEVEDTSQDGQQEDADDEDRNDHTTALWWTTRKKHSNR